MKVVRLSALSTVWFYPPGDTPATHLCESLSRPHSAAGRIKSMKNLNYSIGNQTLELPDCSAGPHPTVPRCAPSSWIKSIHYEEQKLGNVSDIRWKVNNALPHFPASVISRPRPQYPIQKTQTFGSTTLRFSELLVFSKEWVHAVFMCWMFVLQLWTTYFHRLLSHNDQTLWSAIV